MKYFNNNFLKMTIGFLLIVIFGLVFTYILNWYDGVGRYTHPLTKLERLLDW